MNDQPSHTIPTAYNDILHHTAALGFNMGSDPKTCSLLRTLAATKPRGAFLELGTGTGLATAWILDALTKDSMFTTIDNDPKCLEICRKFLGKDKRLNIVLSDGETWVRENINEKFDYIFADTWHGKYIMLDEVLNMLNNGGLYIIDDMITQPNWPDGHQDKVDNLLEYLSRRDDLTVTRLNWATGIVIATKIAKHPA